MLMNTLEFPPNEIKEDSLGKYVEVLVKLHGAKNQGRESVVIQVDPDRARELRRMAAAGILRGYSGGVTFHVTTQGRQALTLAAYLMEPPLGRGAGRKSKYVGGLLDWRVAALRVNATPDPKEPKRPKTGTRGLVTIKRVERVTADLEGVSGGQTFATLAEARAATKASLELFPIAPISAVKYTAARFYSVREGGEEVVRFEIGDGDIGISAAMAEGAKAVLVELQKRRKK